MVVFPPTSNCLVYCLLGENPDDAAIAVFFLAKSRARFFLRKSKKGEKEQSGVVVARFRGPERVFVCRKQLSLYPVLRNQPLVFIFECCLSCSFVSLSDLFGASRSFYPLRENMPARARPHNPLAASQPGLVAQMPAVARNAILSRSLFSPLLLHLACAATPLNATGKGNPAAFTPSCSFRQCTHNP